MNCQNCESCARTACKDRNFGFGFTYPGGATSTGGVNLAVNTALSFVPAGNLIGGLITSIGKLFGAAPRGDLQKFQRNAYPYMRTLAAQSGIPVYIYWFGEAVAVNPDGSYGVTYGKGYAENYERQLVNAGEVPFYAAICDPGVDCVNKPSGLGFQLYDPFDETTTLVETVPYGATVPTRDDTSRGGVTIPRTGEVTPTGQYSAMGIDLKSLMLWGGLAGLAYMLITERKGKGGA